MTGAARVPAEAARWRRSIEQQRDLLAEEAGAIVALLEEIESDGGDVLNRRSVREEIDRLNAILQQVELERRRLGDDLRVCGADGDLPGDWVRLRESTVGEQTKMLQRRLDDWRGEEVAGRRRRDRDKRWLEILLLESDRLLVEARRLRESTIR